MALWADDEETPRASGPVKLYKGNSLGALEIYNLRRTITLGSSFTFSA